MKKDPYLVLGIARTATQEEKEDAWKRKRSQHHPDKGGDSKKFKEVNEAWDEIKDQPVHQTEYERTINFDSAQAFNEFFHRRQSNRYITIEADISIGKAIKGGAYTLTVQLAHSTKVHYVQIDVPPGVFHGETVNYPRLLMGNIDIHVVFNVRKDSVWSLEGLDITKQEQFEIWDLILGTTRDVETIHGTKIRVTIPPMTQPGTKLRLKSHGASSRQNFLQKGDMLVQVQARLPDEIPEDILALIQQLKS